MKAEDLKRWLAVGAGGDTVRLVPVEPPSTGPDVFAKLQDANAAIAAAVAAERERLLPERAALGVFLCSVADNLGDMPISDEWAAKTAKAAVDLLKRNDYFRA